MVQDCVDIEGTMTYYRSAVLCLVGTVYSFLLLHLVDYGGTIVQYYNTGTAVFGLRHQHSIAHKHFQVSTSTTLQVHHT